MMRQKNFFVYGKTFFLRLKKWFLPLFIVAILTTTIVFGLLDLQRQKLSNEFVPKQQTIVVRCQETSKSCLSNSKNIPFFVEHFFQSLLKTLFIDSNSKTNFDTLYSTWAKTIKYNPKKNKKLIFKPSNSSVQVRSLLKNNHRVGYILTLLNGSINDENWSAFSTWIEKPAIKNIFKQIFNNNQFNVTKTTKSNRFFNQIDYRLLIFILVFIAFGLFAIGMLIFFGASWGFFNILFNVAFLTLILLIFNHFGIILTQQNLILLFVTWISTIYWQFQIMRQSQNFIPQKSFLKTVYFNSKSIKKLLIVFGVLTISFLTYFLLVYPDPSKKIILPSLNINHFSQMIFQISIPLLIIWISFTVGILLFFQSLVFIVFFIWQPVYQKLFPCHNIKKSPQTASPLATLQPKPFVLNLKTQVLTSIGLFLLIISFGMLIPFLATNVFSNHLLAQENFVIGKSIFQLEPFEFFVKWKLYLIVLLLTFVFLWFFSWIFLDKYSTLWFVIETLFMIAFYLIIPITFLIAFQPLFGGGFNETLMLFSWILIINEFTQMFLRLSSPNLNQSLTFSNIFKHYNWRSSFVKIGLILLLFSFLLKTHWWLYFYLLITLLVGEMFTVFIRQPYLAIFSNWKQNHQIKRKKMYIEYKKQSFFEREIDGIND